MILILPRRNAWQSGEGIKPYEISSNKTAPEQTHPTIRLGERTTFNSPFHDNPFAPSLPTSHPSHLQNKTTILPSIVRYLYRPMHPIFPSQGYLIPSYENILSFCCFAIPPKNFYIL